MATKVRRRLVLYQSVVLVAGHATPLVCTTAPGRIVVKCFVFELMPLRVVVVAIRNAIRDDKSERCDSLGRIFQQEILAPPNFSNELCPARRISADSGVRVQSSCGTLCEAADGG